MLGVTQILAWGAIFYTPVLIVPLISAERGWSITFGMAGFSLALLTAGLVSPRTGALIDRFGGHRVMPFGSLLGAIGLVGLVYASHPLAYLAVWMLLGVAVVRHAIALSLPTALAIAVLLAVGVPILYGSEFSATVGLGFILLPGALALGVGRVMLSAVIARGHSRWAAWIAAVAVPGAMAGYLLLIPELGDTGAAISSK